MWWRVLVPPPFLHIIYLLPSLFACLRVQTIHALTQRTTRPAFPISRSQFCTYSQRHFSTIEPASQHRTELNGTVTTKAANSANGGRKRMQKICVLYIKMDPPGNCRNRYFSRLSNTHAISTAISYMVYFFFIWI